MRCYTYHKRIVRFMKIMDGMDNSLCIYPSSVLVRTCCEANLPKPVYSDVCKERFRFQFSVQSIGAVSATGYSFRDKSEAMESAALAMLDLLMYQCGIQSTLYSDLAFVKDWSGYNHISGNLKITFSDLLDIVSDISSMVDGIDECWNLFEAEKSRLNDEIVHSSEVSGSPGLVAVLNDCIAELQSTHQFLFTRIGEHTECLYWRGHSHRFYHKGYYEGVYSKLNDLDIKMECIGTLKVTLDKICEKRGYLSEMLPSRCVSENSYSAEIVLTKQGNNAESEKRFNIISATFSNAHECQRDAIFRAISSLCDAEGLKIIDAGYLDLRDMQKENRIFKLEVPLLCDIVAKMKVILEDGFKNIDVLSQQHYRHLKDSKFSKDLRLSLADLICEFVHILKRLNEEAKKMETYSTNPVLNG